MRFIAPLTGVVVAGVLAFAAGAIGFSSHSVSVRTRTVAVAATENVYIRNLGSRYYSDKAIRHAIPAWEQAANRDFAPAWRTPHVKIVLLRRHQRVPTGGILATFKNSGPVSGALAFHGVYQGQPYIVVYSGVGAFYGYSASVSFTHELFEMLADHFISGFNIGYATPFYYVGQVPMQMPRFAPWFNEVCDPVEKYDYKINGVAISDFITPNWFSDPILGTDYDYMAMVQHPYQILKGGYAQYVINGQDNVVQNFKGAGRDASGFLRGERERGLPERGTD